SQGEWIRNLLFALRGIKNTINLKHHRKETGESRDFARHQGLSFRVGKGEQIFRQAVYHAVQRFVGNRLAFVTTSFEDYYVRLVLAQLIEEMTDQRRLSHSRAAVNIYRHGLTAPDNGKSIFEFTQLSFAAYKRYRLY